MNITVTIAQQPKKQPSDSDSTVTTQTSSVPHSFPRSQLYHINNERIRPHKENFTKETATAVNTQKELVLIEGTNPYKDG